MTDDGLLRSTIRKYEPETLKGERVKSFEELLDS